VFSISDAIGEETEKLVEVVEQEQGSLKALVYIYSPWSHIIPLIAVSGSHLDMMG